MAYILIRGSDQSKYGKFNKGLESQFSLDNSQYTKTIVTAVDALNNHNFDMKYYESQKRNRDRSRPEPNEKTSETGFSQKTEKNIIFHCYDKPGNIISKCNLKDYTPKKDWYIHKAVNNYQEREDDGV